MYYLKSKLLYRKFKQFAGFLWYLVTYLGFLLRCNILTFPGDNKVATVYRRSSHKNNQKYANINYLHFSATNAFTATSCVFVKSGSRELKDLLGMPFNIATQTTAKKKDTQPYGYKVFKIERLSQIYSYQAYIDT